MDERLKLLDKIKIRLNGYVYKGDYKKEGWKEPLPFYLFECPVHGLVEGYPKGHSKRLECPICREEEEKIKSKKLAV